MTAAPGKTDFPGQTPTTVDTDPRKGKIMTRQRKAWNLVLLAASTTVVAAGLYLTPTTAAYAIAAAWATLAIALLAQVIRN